MADIFVNDAFGTAHRAHASTAGVADYLPAVCGFLIQKEISIMGKALSRSGASVRRHPGRRKGLRQDRRHQQPAREGATPSSSAAAWPTPSSRPRATSIGTSLLRRRQARLLARDMMKKAEEQGRQAAAAGRHRRGRSTSRTRSTRTGRCETVTPTPSRPTWMGLDIGQKTRELFCRRCQGRQAPSSGTARWACSRIRQLRQAAPSAVAKALAESGRCFHHRRRRLRSCLRAAGLCRQDHPHLHRRRRFPGVPRGSGAARHRLPAGQVSPLGTLYIGARSVERSV